MLLEFSMVEDHCLQSIDRIIGYLFLGFREVEVHTSSAAHIEQWLWGLGNFLLICIFIKKFDLITLFLISGAICALNATELFLNDNHTIVQSLF